MSKMERAYLRLMRDARAKYADGYARQGDVIAGKHVLKGRVSRITEAGHRLTPYGKGLFMLPNPYTTKTYRLGSSPMVNAPRLVQWAIHGWKTSINDSERMHFRRVIQNTWNLPAEAARGLVSEDYPYKVGDDKHEDRSVVVFTVPKFYKNPQACKDNPYAYAAYVFSDRWGRDLYKTRESAEYDIERAVADEVRSARLDPDSKEGKQRAKRLRNDFSIREVWLDSSKWKEQKWQKPIELMNNPEYLLSDLLPDEVIDKVYAALKKKTPNVHRKLMEVLEPYREGLAEKEVMPEYLAYWLEYQFQKGGFQKNPWYLVDDGGRVANGPFKTRDDAVRAIERRIL
jgi:hypothetical protein